MNDLAVACEALRRVVASDPALSVAWTARDGVAAVEMAARERPDVVLMDLIMPRMDGVEATRRIMRATPCPILVVTATVSGNATLVYEALGAGALDAVNTPTLGTSGVVEGGAELLRRLHRVAGAAAARTPVPAALPAIAEARTPPAGAPRVAATAPDRGLGVPPVVAIGASTGGPSAVAKVLSALPEEFPAAVLIVQHVSTNFIPGLIEWLSAETKRPVAAARAGHLLRAGDVLVAAEERHLACGATGVLEYRDEPREQLHRPAVDELFFSLAALGRPGVAALLTGMGRDGAEGLLRLRQAGWRTIAQDEATSVVWGMPGTALRLGAAMSVLPLDAIGPAVTAAVAALRTRGGAEPGGEAHARRGARP